LLFASLVRAGLKVSDGSIAGILVLVLVFIVLGAWQAYTVQASCQLGEKN
jgi:hypothetical protein